MSGARLGLVLLAAFGGLACDPSLRGVCKIASDCPAELACVNQVCVNPSFASPPGGTCTPTCAQGQTCQNGTCVDQQGVGIQITSPMEGVSLAGQLLKVTIQASAPDTIDVVEARLLARGQVVLLAAAQLNGGAYEATLDLSQSQITDGSYELVARMYRGEKRDDSASVHLLIDKTGPTIALLPIEYPERPAGSPAAGAFLRDEQITIDAAISDALTGLSNDPPVLLSLGMDPVIGVPLDGHLVRFSFSARAPVFKAISGTIGVKILATDLAGNSTTVSTSVQLTRHRWTWAKGGTRGTSTAPAIIGNLLVIGGDDSSLHGIRRETGAHAWDITLSGQPVGHITAGQSRVYAALKDGHVVGIDPRDGNVGQRLQFTCPSSMPGPLQPQLRTQVSGLSLAMTPVSSSNNTMEETLFAYSADGYVQMFRKSEFPNGYGQGNGCIVETSTGGRNDGSTPSLVSQDGNLNVLVGDASGQVHNVILSFAQQPFQTQSTFSLDEKWGNTTGGTITSAVAVGRPKDVLGLLVASGNGLVQALDTHNGTLWSSRPVSGTAGLRATPVMTSDFAWQHDQNGRVQQLSLTDGAFVWSQDAEGPMRSFLAGASPIVSRDGSVFVTGGHQLVGFDSSGRSEWTFSDPAGQNAQLDKVAPVFGCDGTIYVVSTTDNQATVYALITDSTGGIASSGWPAGRHDSRNTGNTAQPLAGADSACAD